MRRRLHEELILIAPTPVLARLEAPDDRMSSRVVMMSGVFVRRIVAAADVAAGETQSKVHPLAAGGETFFAPRRSTGLRVLNLIQVRTRRSHEPFLN